MTSVFYGKRTPGIQYYWLLRDHCNKEKERKVFCSNLFITLQ